MPPKKAKEVKGQKKITGFFVKPPAPEVHVLPPPVGPPPSAPVPVPVFEEPKEAKGHKPVLKRSREEIIEEEEEEGAKEREALAAEPATEEEEKELAEYEKQLEEEKKAREAFKKMTKEQKAQEKKEREKRAAAERKKEGGVYEKQVKRQLGLLKTAQSRAEAEAKQHFMIKEAEEVAEEDFEKMQKQMIREGRLGEKARQKLLDEEKRAAEAAKQPGLTKAEKELAELFKVKKQRTHARRRPRRRRSYAGRRRRRSRARSCCVNRSRRRSRSRSRSHSARRRRRHSTRYRAQRYLGVNRYNVGSDTVVDKLLKAQSEARNRYGGRPVTTYY